MLWVIHDVGAHLLEATGSIKAAPPSASQDPPFLEGSTSVYKQLQISWFSPESLELGAQSLPEPELSQESREAFDVAYNNIRRFHEAQKSEALEVETMPGVRCRRVTRPIGELCLQSSYRL